MPTEVLVDEGKGVEGGPGENPDNPGNVLEPTPAPVDAGTPTRSQIIGTPGSTGLEYGGDPPADSAAGEDVTNVVTQPSTSQTTPSPKKKKAPVKRRRNRARKAKKVRVVEDNEMEEDKEEEKNVNKDVDMEEQEEKKKNSEDKDVDKVDKVEDEKMEEETKTEEEEKTETDERTEEEEKTEEEVQTVEKEDEVDDAMSVDNQTDAATTDTDVATKGSGTTIITNDSSSKIVEKAMGEMTFDEVNKLAPDDSNIVETPEKEDLVDTNIEDMKTNEDAKSEGAQSVEAEDDIHHRSEDSVHSASATATTVSVFFIKNTEFPSLPTKQLVISSKLKLPHFNDLGVVVPDEERYWFQFQNSFEKFPQEQIDKIKWLEEKWNKVKERGIKCSKIGDIVVNSEDVVTLEGTTWLNDKIIDACVAVLSSKYHTTKQDGDPNILCFDTRFGQLIEEEISDKENPNKPPAKKYMYTKVRKMMITRLRKFVDDQDKEGNINNNTVPTSPFDYDVLLFPVNTSNGHWHMAVVYPQRKTIEFIDSLSPRCGCYHARLVFRWLMDHSYHDDPSIDENRFFELFDPTQMDYGWTYWDTSPSVIKQMNSYDCGVFVLCYIECFFFRYSITSLDSIDVTNRRLKWRWLFSPAEFFLEHPEDLPEREYVLPWPLQGKKLHHRYKKLEKNFETPELPWYEAGKKLTLLLIKQGLDQCYGCGSCPTCLDAITNNVIQLKDNNEGKTGDKTEAKAKATPKYKDDDKPLFPSDNEEDDDDDEMMDENYVPSSKKKKEDEEDEDLSVASDDSILKNKGTNKRKAPTSAGNNPKAQKTTAKAKGKRKRKVRSPSEEAEYQRKLEERKEKQREKEKLQEAEWELQDQEREYLGSDDEEEDDNNPTNKYKNVTRKSSNQWKLRTGLSDTDVALMEELLESTSLAETKLLEGAPQDAKYFQARKNFIAKVKANDGEMTEQEEMDWMMIKTWFYKIKKKSLQEVVVGNQVAELRKKEENAPMYRERYKRREAAKKIFLTTRLDETVKTLEPGSVLPKEAFQALAKEFQISEREKKYLLKQVAESGADEELFEAYTHLMFVPGKYGNTTEHNPENGPMLYWDETNDKGKTFRVYKTAYFRGSVKFRRKDGRMVRREDILNPAWVRNTFNIHYVESLRRGPRIWFKIPIGSGKKLEQTIKDDKASIYLDGLLVAQGLKTQVVCEYQQNNNDYCLGYAVASALKYMGYEEEANWVIRESSKWGSMDGDEAMIACGVFMRDFVPEMGQWIVYNKPRKSGPIIPMKVDDFIKNKQSKTLKVVIPVAEDGSSDHAVTVVDDIIFDARVDYALKLTKESFHLICGKGGMEQIGYIYDFYESFRTKKKLTRKFQKNWSY